MGLLGYKSRPRLSHTDYGRVWAQSSRAQSASGVIERRSWLENVRMGSGGHRGFLGPDDEEGRGVSDPFVVMGVGTSPLDRCSRMGEGVSGRCRA